MELYDAGVGDVITLPTHHPQTVTVTGYSYAEMWRAGDFSHLTWRGTGRWSGWAGTTLLSDKTQAALVSKAGPDDPLRRQYEADLEAQLAAMLAADDEGECCDRCDGPLPAIPVTDPDDLMRRRFCSSDCLTTAAEASFEQRYQTGRD